LNRLAQDSGAGFSAAISLPSLSCRSIISDLHHKFSSQILSRFFLCPETGGKTLEQVDYLFTKNPAMIKGGDDVERWSRAEDEKEPHVTTKE
jgi:hypothetical protein